MAQALINREQGTEQPEEGERGGTRQRPVDVGRPWMDGVRIQFAHLLLS